LQLAANSPLKAPSRAFGQLDPFYLADLPNGSEGENSTNFWIAALH